jgi:aryl-alcohol dehydrogenase-like predicted oxidoreductase
LQWLRPFGATGFSVSAISFGAMHFDGIQDENEVGSLLNQVVDAGVNLIDTARGYGRSEERIGRHLSYRRKDFVLSTKVGYGVDGVEDWTYNCIVRGVERALAVMRTDFIDICHLHSCPLHILERGEVQQGLADCARDGKIRVAAYSGENAELAYALADSRIGSVMLSLSLTDRANALRLTPEMHHGVLVKRALACLAWTRQSRPNGDGEYCEGIYYDRWQALLRQAGFAELTQQHGIGWPEIALRWVLAQPGVSSITLGTRSVARIRESQAWLAKGALPQPLVELVSNAWQQARGDADQVGWQGIV